MGRMFYDCTSITWLDLSNWNTSNVISMQAMFYQCSGLVELNIKNWDTNNVTDMSFMFLRCNNLTWLDLGGWNTSNVTNMEGMFAACNNLEKVCVSTWFVTNNVIDSEYMFEWCENLVWWNGTTYDANHTNAEYARIDGQNWLSGYFTKVITTTTLLPWADFNQAIKKLVSNKSVASTANQGTLKKIVFTWTMPSVTRTGVVSVSWSEYPVIAWFKTDTIYLVTEADIV